jgi:hypothetical protein
MDMRKLVVALMALMVVPAIARAQVTNDADASRAPNRLDPERAEKRMRLARTLGLAEALDLDAAAALKLGDQLAKFDERRKPVRKQAADARDLLREAARGGKASASQVDGAIAKLLEARGQMQALDREMLQAVTRDLSPEQKARATLFLGTFRDRIERRAMRFHGGPGPDGDRGMMRGPRHGMGPGMGGADDPRSARVPGAWDGAGDEPPPFADDVEAY